MKKIISFLDYNLIGKISMIVKSFFVKSITDLKYRPLPKLSEVFLMGRSNVGKSSFINVLVNKKKMAFISKKPGKTVTLNYFLLNNYFYLVDSPGYGYMQRKLTIKENIIPMLTSFLRYNLFIKIIFQLIDFQVGPTFLDLEIYKILNRFNLQPILILNKKDKVPLTKINYRFQKIKKVFDELGYPSTSIYLLSCKNKDGLNNIIKLIHDKIYI
ncbi:MAG: ribosome biogenesis GTP-binding protein YihA/YsxC [Candidatus Phytoplasma stylosanthis]|uniref:ribosome biogenesis GTP-binding protein YihA/YsxC n=1 Tax=Candidatus Phytoplasma stylosanthis TaxID=2798314 RepID=UPI00293A5D64|nr:ribosome biogenesis GTP-binding protein YihA/YsxC [Candidatus Phytoplasma stylosanthis]MDV3168090.1 ribosome biogenesis GTP-binding protein YihA/YsxC [Candidatus Phytoplasma stylosanthis]MDV3171093.1 ribosome biogenesis GTP-binding protein YihA/YsxC [Candidatus Phytoplasma stylosanthis]MDV3173569.1 ribosome biogenesis GTP-binding protein YihA/YsxC [Candidatus Phytoplasma stylosanthis]MDV3174381.1 ribosome biogenesis GTP-binding protein YihA/YsxC [Candidatus Phytoplasma stylosanthis]MDV32024